MTDDELRAHFPTKMDVSLDEMPQIKEFNEERLRRSERLRQQKKTVRYHNGISLVLDDQGFP